MMENCNLCGKSFDKLTLLSNKSHLETLSFLKSSSIQNAKLCQSCFSKVQMIAGLKQQTVEEEEEEVVINEDTIEEDDVGLEELDHLSSFYAEQDENDPDFVPNVISSKKKKSNDKIIESKKKERQKRRTELKCQLCQASFSRVIALRRHFLNDHQDIEQKEWQCNECEEICSDKSTLISHFIKTHVAINNCKKCGKKFRLARSLRNHIANYCSKINGGQQKPCDVCDKLIPTNMLVSHKAFSHCCSHCSAILPNRREKCKHLREIHQITKSLKNSSKNHHCKRCQQSFASSLLLSEHLISKHSDDSDLVTACPHQGCKQKFPKGSIKLRTHLKKFHDNNQMTKIYKYECSTCFSCFKSAEILKSHIQSKHENDKKIKCPFCSYVLPLKRKSDLYRHHFRVTHPELAADIIKAHDAKLAKWKADLAVRAKIQCLMCSFAGVKTSNMARHYVDVHGYDASIADAPDADDEMPDGALCTECGEIYINRHGLMRHLIKAHSKPAGEQCLYCPFRYVDIIAHIDAVHSHQKNSNDEQLCQKCVPSQKFKDFNELLRHTRIFHRKKNIIKKDQAKLKKLCENCGKLAKHKSNECPKLNVDNDHDNVEELIKKKYVPIHLSGTCPYCEFKFADLLGHIRHGHANEKLGDKASACPLCAETFGSVRELVTHRQLHPQFKCHVCSKCSLEFETVVQLRLHRAKSCTKSKKAKKKVEQEVVHSSNAINNPPAAPIDNALNTLMLMANLVNVEDNDDHLLKDDKPVKSVDYEGRGTVACHLCKKTFILKTLLKRHYIASHGYDPNAATMPNNESKTTCQECRKELPSLNEAIKHHLDCHGTLSGQICPYCDCKYGAKKFDNLDQHVSKYHVLEMQSPVQTCSTCKTNFHNYEALKVHRQIHEGGNRPRILVDVTSGEELISVHPRVGAKPEISNRGGLKCQLCNAFKLRKDHLKLHYVRHHGYDPKAKETSSIQDHHEDSMQGAPDEPQIECPSCHLMFESNHTLIKHLLKNHCIYSGLICPYCPGHFPSRFIDLQGHVTTNHLDKLTGYNISNQCKVCHQLFSGYAELRDHVQHHGDGYKDPLASSNNQSKKPRKKRNDTINSETDAKRTKVLVPVASDSSGQLRLSPDALQKAILMVTKGGQVENVPKGGLLLDF